MKKLLLLAVAFFPASGVRAQSTSSTWRDVTAGQWNVFNSGTGNVSLVCDQGTMNRQTSISLASQTGKTVTTDGTNCFAH